MTTRIAAVAALCGAPATGALAAALSLAACGPARHPAPAAADSAFAGVQARGADPRAMGVDQYASVHRFDALAEGGRIELQMGAPPAGAPRGPADTAGVAQVRRHLRAVAAAVAAGDFRTPAYVHARVVPGTAVMAAKRGVIAYAFRDLPRGGEVRITTRDPEALRAVHAFVALQRADHRAGGAGDPGPTPGAHPAHAGQHGHP